MNTGMTETEMRDYIAAVDLEGITLTHSGRVAARIILERRKEWTASHELMLSRILNGVEKLPHKLGRLVGKTRLGAAIELARKLTRGTRRNQKRRERAKARAAA